ncbi:hypothetical protein [Tenacibaculum halocynthiae]
MIEKLIVDFFTSIEKDESITSRNGKAVFFVEELLERRNEIFDHVSVQKISRLHKRYVEKEKDIPVSAPDLFIKDVMAEYLGFEDYEDFKLKNSNLIKDNTIENISNKETSINITKPTTSPPINSIKQKVIITISITLLSVSSFIFFKRDYIFNTGNCIVWNKDHYERTVCTNERAISDTLYHINIAHFKKVVLTKNMEFFTDGVPNYWYGTNGKGKREFFTARGVHPETKRELDEITEYILEQEGLINY